jgi:hypothetical protein
MTEDGRSQRSSSWRARPGGCALPRTRAPFQIIPIRMKRATSLIMATVRNTSLAERGFMNASHLASPGSKPFRLENWLKLAGDWLELARADERARARQPRAYEPRCIRLTATRRSGRSSTSTSLSKMMRSLFRGLVDDVAHSKVESCVLVRPRLLSICWTRSARGQIKRNRCPVTSLRPRMI